MTRKKQKYMNNSQETKNNSSAIQETPVEVMIDVDLLGQNTKSNHEVPEVKKERKRTYDGGDLL